MGGKLEWTVSTLLSEKCQEEQVESLGNGWRVVDTLTVTLHLLNN